VFVESVHLHVTPVTSYIEFLHTQITFSLKNFLFELFYCVITNATQTTLVFSLPPVINWSGDI